MKSYLFFFFLESTCALCPWSLALASSIPVLGLESICPRKGCPWPWPWPRIFFVSLALALASSLVSSTPPLTTICLKEFFWRTCFLSWPRALRSSDISVQNGKWQHFCCSLKIAKQRSEDFRADLQSVTLQVLWRGLDCCNFWLLQYL